jgi:pimeloyl-ACP methyl ester carboxylesterase
MTPLVRTAFGALSAISPRLAGNAALRLFNTPLKISRLTTAEKRLAERADKKLRDAEDISFDLNGKRIAAYRFAPTGKKSGKRIVLVHGWMSAARYMLAIATALQECGHEVICLDLPAHGASGGRSTNLVECAEALNALLQNSGGADIIVAHSFGGAVTAYLLSRVAPKALGPDGRVILLASPNQLSSVTAWFSKALGLNAKAQHHYETRLCAAIGASLDEMDGNIMYAKAGYPLHIIHCSEDEEVPVEQSRRFLDLGNLAQLTELSGLGHRRILYQTKALDALITAVR